MGYAPPERYSQHAPAQSIAIDALSLLCHGASSQAILPAWHCRDLDRTRLCANFCHVNA